MEIRIKVRWKVTCCMCGGNWREMMKNEENRGPIEKKKFLWGLVGTFCQFSFGALSLLSLSLSQTRFCWITLALDQERKMRQEEGRSKKGRAWSRNYNMILSRCQFACAFSLLDLACMILHVVLCCYGMGFSRYDSVFILAFPFSNNHGVIGFSCFGWARFLDEFEAEWGGSLNNITHGLVTPEPNCGLW